MSPSQESNSTGPDTSTPAAVQWQTALDAVGGDEELLRSVTEILITEAPRQVQALRLAVQTGNAKEVRRWAHTLKGSLMHYGAVGAMDLAERIEGMGQAGETAAAAPLLDPLDSAVAGVVQALLNYMGSNSPPAS